MTGRHAPSARDDGPAFSFLMHTVQRKEGSTNERSCNPPRRRLSFFPLLSLSTSQSLRLPWMLPIPPGPECDSHPAGSAHNGRHYPFSKRAYLRCPDGSATNILGKHAGETAEDTGPCQGGPEVQALKGLFDQSGEKGIFRAAVPGPQEE